MANKKFWLGMLVMVLAFGMMAAACKTEADSKPAKLESGATAAQALDTLNAIIAYSETPATIKAMAETMKTTWSSYSSSWTTRGASTITAINAMIDQIP